MREFSPRFVCLSVESMNMAMAVMMKPLRRTLELRLSYDVNCRFDCVQPARSPRPRICMRCRPLRHGDEDNNANYALYIVSYSSQQVCLFESMLRVRLRCRGLDQNEKGKNDAFVETFVR